MARLLAMIAATLLLVPALSGCPADSEPEEVSTPATADLSAFERRRSGSSGAALEERAMAARSAGAHQVYASTESEPTLIDLEISGKLPEEMAMGDEASAGTAVPSDLDRASETIGPWIDMDLVGRAIRSQHRSLKSCWDREGSGSDKRVDVRLTVDTRGRVDDARIAGSSPVKGAALERCMVGVLEKTSFPEAREGAKTFTYVLRF